MSSRKQVLVYHQIFPYSLSEIVNKYLEWLSDVKYMILNKIHLGTFESEVFAVKCSKRGNDVYCYRVYRRFKGLASLAEKTVFFNPKDRNLNKTTRALFLTLTYDTKLCSLADAWKNIGKEFNRFMSHVRKLFGKVSSCRVFEVFQNGYPHIHCLLLFHPHQVPLSF